MGNEASQEGGGYPEGMGPPQQAGAPMGPRPQMMDPRPPFQQQGPAKPATAALPFRTPGLTSSVGPPSSNVRPQGPPMGMQRPQGPPMAMQRPQGPPPGASNGPPMMAPPGVDMSNLSEEEKAMILSVMARAQNLEEDIPPPQIRAPVVQKEPELVQHVSATSSSHVNSGHDVISKPRTPPPLCPLCQNIELTNDNSSRCGQCNKTTCQRCGKVVASSDGRRQQWMCRECIKRRNKQQEQQHQQRSSETLETRGTHGEERTSKSSFGGGREARSGHAEEGGQNSEANRRSEMTNQQSRAHAQEKAQEQVRREEAMTREYALPPDVGAVVAHGVQLHKENEQGREDAIRNHDYDEYDEDYEREGEEMMDSDDEELEEDLEVVMQQNHVLLQPMPYYDRSPGEVYTIPEEEEEGMSDSLSKIAASDLNSDTASSLLRWRGMGQTSQKGVPPQNGVASQKPQQKGNYQGSNQQQQSQQGYRQQQQHQGAPGVEMQKQTSSLRQQQQQINSTNNKAQTGHQRTEMKSMPGGALSPVAPSQQQQLLQQQQMVEQQMIEAPRKDTNSIPRTFPLTQLTQNVQQQQSQIPQTLPSSSTQPNPAQQQQAYLQQQQSQQKQQKPKSIDLQSQKQKKTAKPEPQDWSPVTDLSPIMDVSPSIEAAEQELMEKFKERPDSEDEQQIVKMTIQSSIPRATSGTISGMIADFNKALGLVGTSPVDEAHLARGLSPGESPVSAGAMITELQADQSQVYRQMATQQQVPPPPAPALQQQQQQQQSPSMPKRIHRRLPQPTMEQMQAAVAMASQSPRGKFAVPTTTQRNSPNHTPTPAVIVANPNPPVTISTVSGTRPVSPMMPRRPEIGLPISNQPGHQQQIQQQNVQMRGQVIAGVPQDMMAKTRPYQLVSQTGNPVVPSTLVTINGRFVGTTAPTIMTSAVPVSTVMTASVAPSSVVVQQSSIPDYLQAHIPTMTLTQPSPMTDMYPTTMGGYNPVDSFRSTSPSKTPGTPQTPSTQGGDSDTQSEADSTKSGKIRRKLPSLPQDQEPSPTPVRRTKDRTRTLSMGATPLTQIERTAASAVRGERRTPQRTSSLDGMVSSTTSVTPTITTTPSSTGTAESLRISDSPLSSITRTTSYTSEPSSVSEMLGRRDMSAPHSLSSYLRSPSSILGPDLGRGGTSSSGASSEVTDLFGTKLPTYMKSLKQQLKEELKTVTEERRRLLEYRDRERGYYRRSETDLATLINQPWSADGSQYDALATAHRQILMGSSPTPSRRVGVPRTSPQASPRRSRHHRQLSDQKPFSPMKDVRDVMNMYKNQPGFKSYEFESIDERLRPMGTAAAAMASGGYPGSLKRGSTLDGGRVYHRGSSLSDIRYEGEFSHLPLKDTAIKTIMAGGCGSFESEEYLKRYFKDLRRQRRPSEGSTSDILPYGMLDDPYGRSASTYYMGAKKRKPRKPRSWHPSPYVSEDEDEQMTREEKKAKIKEEIARRRQQIEENSLLHDELVKLARLRDRGEQIGLLPGERSYSSTHSMDSLSTASTRSPVPDMRNTTSSSSVLQAIDEILRKDAMASNRPTYTTARYYGKPGPTSKYATAPSGYSGHMPGYDYAKAAMTGLGWYGRDQQNSPSTRFPDNTDEDKSIARLASTFPPDERGAYLTQPFEHTDFSPMTTDTETPTDNDPTPAMPLLPDMPTRSRKLLEDLGSSPIIGGPSDRNNGTAPPPYRERVDSERSGHSDEPIANRLGEGGTTILRQNRKGQVRTTTKTSQKYEFPVKRILLTRDPKDRTVSGNGLGMKVVGGKEIPGTGGLIGAYVAKVYPGGVVETLGEVKEGDQVLEWNGIALTGKTYEDVQRIIASSGDEVEIVIRSDFNMLTPNRKQGQTRPSPRMGTRGRGGNHTNHQNGPVGGGHSAGGQGGPSYPQNQDGGEGQFRKVGGNYPQYESDDISNSSSYDNLDPSPTKEQKDKDKGSSDFNPKPQGIDPYALPSLPGEPPPVPGYGTSHPNPNGSPSKTKSDSFSENNKYTYRAENLTGEIQLQVCYDQKASILYVTIVRARNLTTNRDNSGLPDPFVKCYILPGRCMENQRRTRYFSRCSCPEWKQTMVYPNITIEQLRHRFFEISVWNYDIYRPNEFLGEIILDLSDSSVIDEQSRWYKLHDHDEQLYPQQSRGANQSRSAGSLGSESSGGSHRKMARLNAPWPKLDGNEDYKKGYGQDKKTMKNLSRKSVSSNDNVRGSEWSTAAQSAAHVPHYKPDCPSLNATGLPWCCVQYPMMEAFKNIITTLHIKNTGNGIIGTQQVL